MKVCILTYPLHSNFGCLMQAWALQQVLKQLGHEPTTINIRPHKGSLKGRVYRYCKGVIQESIRNRRLCLYPNKWNQHLHKIIDKYTELFINNNLSVTPVIDNWNKRKLKKATRDFDAFIVGSDQVWRKQYVKEIDLFFLSFVSKDCPLLSYAASFGIDKVDYGRKYNDRCKKLIQRFKAVSVRESDAIGLCSTNFGIEAVQVVDPTLLLSKNAYLTLISSDESNRIIPQKPYLLAYLLDANDQKTQIESYALEKGLDVLFIKPDEIPPHMDLDGDLSSYVYPSISTWLDAFNKATEVITDSFHGTVFSIIFEKQFHVLRNQSRGNSRLYSLLDSFGLSSQLVSCVKNDCCDTPIAWNVIKKLKDEMRVVSVAFLKNNIR